MVKYTKILQWEIVIKSRLQVVAPMQVQIQTKLKTLIWNLCSDLVHISVASNTTSKNCSGNLRVVHVGERMGGMDSRA